jgi:hypothetical protein
VSTAIPTYGVYLRPDPLTCRAVSDLTDILRRQFGIVSAAAFPPHATLAGAVPSDASTEELVAALDPVLRTTKAFPVHNAGISRHNVAITFDVDRTRSGEKNAALKDLAVAVNQALEPLRAPVEGYRMGPFVADDFRAHLSLASHDLDEAPHLREEVEEFVRALPYTAPADFTADTITLFRFHSADWRGQWWHDLTWTHLHTWRLDPA